MKIKDEHKLTPGVYHLISNGEVIYVGQTINVECRISDHKTSYEFDSYAFFKCKTSDMSDLEAEHIVKFSPENNKTLPVNNIYISAPAAKYDIKRIVCSAIDEINNAHVGSTSYRLEERVLKYIKIEDYNSFKNDVYDSYMKIVKESHKRECKK